MTPRGFLRGGVTGASERHGEAYGRGERTAQATNGDEMARGADVGEGGHRQVPSGDKKAPRACMHSGALLQHYTMRRGRPELLRVLAHLAASSSSGRAAFACASCVQSRSAANVQRRDAPRRTGCGNLPCATRASTWRTLIPRSAATSRILKSEISRSRSCSAARATCSSRRAWMS